MRTRRFITFLSVLLAVAVLLLGGCPNSGRGTVPEASYRAENPYMQMAIDEARDGIYHRDGGPFGCVIVKDDAVVGQGHNRVLAKKDSTCHGEMEAIRDAEKKLGTYDLTGCVLYTTGEPCMMCLAASKWAYIDHIYYGCTLEDNSNIGFRDVQIDEEVGGRSESQDYMEETDRDACLKLFEEYKSLDSVIY